MIGQISLHFMSILALRRIEDDRNAQIGRSELQTTIIYKLRKFPIRKIKERKTNTIFIE